MKQYNLWKPRNRKPKFLVDSSYMAPFGKCIDILYLTTRGNIIEMQFDEATDWNAILEFTDIQKWCYKSDLLYGKTLVEKSK